MAQIPDDIGKAVDISTDAFIKAQLFDAQILEDQLKLSIWLSGFAIATLLIIASNFQKIIVVDEISMKSGIAYASISFFVLSLVLSGFFHSQVNRVLAIKR